MDEPAIYTIVEDGDGEHSDRYMRLPDGWHRLETVAAWTWAEIKYYEPQILHQSQASAELDMTSESRTYHSIITAAHPSDRWTPQWTTHTTHHTLTNNENIGDLYNKALEEVFEETGWPGTPEELIVLFWHYAPIETGD